MPLLARMVALSCLCSLSAAAQTASSLDVPPNEKLVLQVHGEGLQIYTCTAHDGSFAWIFKAPDADLMDDAGKVIGKHFAGPKWQLEDGSEVQGKLMASQSHAETIPWLLLSATSTGKEGKLSHVDMVRRTETVGGAAPSSCDAGHVGLDTSIEYGALYSFYSSH